MCSIVYNVYIHILCNVLISYIIYKPLGAPGALKEHRGHRGEPWGGTLGAPWGHPGGPWVPWWPPLGHLDFIENALPFSQQMWLNHNTCAQNLYYHRDRSLTLSISCWQTPYFLGCQIRAVGVRIERGGALNHCTCSQNPRGHFRGTICPHDPCLHLRSGCGAGHIPRLFTCDFRSKPQFCIFVASLLNSRRPLAEYTRPDHW